MVAIAICDTGEGMDEETLSRAFEPFFTTKPVGKGTGLGLSQIFGFAAQSGGRAELDSAPGEGTIVRLLLPRSDKEASVVGATEAVAARGNGRVVLVVEDNDHVREFAEQLLVDLDYRVLSADSAAAALALLDRHHVDIVFSDVVMPDRSGLDLAGILAESRPGLPVVLATGFSHETVTGAPPGVEILSKPYGADTLGAVLARALAERRSA
jgi:CheY-like chemotaxis protein